MRKILIMLICLLSFSTVSGCNKKTDEKYYFITKNGSSASNYIELKSDKWLDSYSGIEGTYTTSGHPKSGKSITLNYQNTEYYKGRLLDGILELWDTENERQVYKQKRIENKSFQVDFVSEFGDPIPFITRTILGFNDCDNTLTYPDYAFAGWFYDQDYIKQITIFENYILVENTTIYAKWDRQVFTITYHQENPSNPNLPLKESVTLNQTFTFKTLSKPGYTFWGWETEDGTLVANLDGYVIGGNWSIAEDITIYPQWRAKSFDIVLDLQSGTLPSGSSYTHSVTYLELFDLPVPTRLGYEFLGWADLPNSSIYYTDNEGKGIKAYDYTMNTVLYARWKAI